MKPSNTTAYFLMLLFWLFYLAPFQVPALNQLEPRLFDLPFTVWGMLLAIVLSWVVSIWSSRCVWDTFDGKEEEGEK